MYYIKNIIQESEFKYYFLGLICADGWISKVSNRVELTLKESDKQFLETIGSMITDKKVTYRQKQKAYRLTLENKQIKDELMKYINSYDKTVNLTYPLNIPNKYQKDFIRGYIDGDGNISVKMSYAKNGKKCPGIRLRVLGTHSFLLGLAQMFKILGLVNFVRMPSRKNPENVYYIEYAFSSAERILEYLYDNSTFKLTRKYNVYKIIKSLDSDTLISNYGTVNGHYNTQQSDNSDKDIVGAYRNI